jgi:hypothetical protein
MTIITSIIRVEAPGENFTQPGLSELCTPIFMD